MTGNCGTCQHWGRTQDRERASRACRAIGFVGEGEPLAELDGESSGIDDWVLLFTRADFGCVLHEPVTEVDPVERPLSPQVNVHTVPDGRQETQ